MPTPQEILEKQVKISDLFHIYGDLLSDRQRTFIQLYYDENLSLSEIAVQHSISRQAVHDAIKHGRRALERYETALGLRESRESQTVVATDSHFRENAELILGEIESSVRAIPDEFQPRLKAQLASLRDLLNNRGGDTSREEAA